METKICSKCNTLKDILSFSLETRHDGRKYYRNTCKQCRYASENKEKRKLRNKRFSDKRRKTEEYKLWRKNYEYHRYHSDTNFRLAYILRRRLKVALKNNAKKGKTLDYLGCSIEELKNYLEKKFTKDMTWENQGKVWHIDHIKPLAIFNLSNENELKEACHFTNLQPLLAIDNIKKGSNYEYK